MKYFIAPPFFKKKNEKRNECNTRNLTPTYFIEKKKEIKIIVF